MAIIKFYQANNFKLMNTQLMATTNSNSKLIFYRAIEKDVQQYWADNNIFEANPDCGKVPYMATFPYPYMNGRLHLGHTFTLSKAEFATKYNKLRGRNAIFPFGFHCTGMPIKACADRLKRELNDPTDIASKQDNSVKLSSRYTSQRSKVSTLPQWKILTDMGVKKEELESFQDPNAWLEYFPPLAMSDLKLMGLGVDWRRSFITTEANPYYDAFVRWQYIVLKEKGYLEFGKRFTIFEPMEKQPCLDHDRQVGEGVQPLEFILVKCYLNINRNLLDVYSNGAIVAFVSCSRVDQIIGLSHCWVFPQEEYDIVELPSGEIAIISAKAIHNLSFQDFSFTKCSSVAGQVLVDNDASITTPFGKSYPLISHPGNNFKATGFIPAVPAADIEDLYFTNKLNEPTQKKILKKYSNLVSSKYNDGNLATHVWKEFGLRDLQNEQLLQNAKVALSSLLGSEQTRYIWPYQQSVLETCNSLLGEPSIVASSLRYAEPENVVISRSGNECVVSLTDQWYIKYGSPEWRDLVKGHIENMETFNAETKNKLLEGLKWLGKWACSRTFGLGTKLPWDNNFVLDSLSDSTIYMAYYTISHLLQGDMYGKTPGPLGIIPHQLTPEVFNFIFLSKPYDAQTMLVEKSKLEALKSEFEYWYPLSLRVTGKDLTTNHLLFFVYQHVAIFDKKYWPLAIRINGHVLKDSEKMSKSRGNVMSLKDAVEMFSADGMRMALADAGDFLDDANFVSKTAESCLLKLVQLVDWLKRTICSEHWREDVLWADTVFDALLTQAFVETDLQYQRTNYKEALKYGFFGMENSRHAHKLLLGDHPQLRKLIVKFAELQAYALAPIAPHFAEYIWRHILEKNSSIFNTIWPQVSLTQEHKLTLQAYDYVLGVAPLFRTQKKKNSSSLRATIMVSAIQMPLEKRIIDIIVMFLPNTPNSEQLMDKLQGDSLTKGCINKAMSIAKHLLKTSLHSHNVEELSVLRQNHSYLCEMLKLDVLTVVDFDSLDPSASSVDVRPWKGKPVIQFE